MTGLLPQVFFTSVLIVALALMGRSAIDTNARLYTSQVLQATSALDAARDSVEIESVTPGSPPQDLTIAVRNNGRRDISNWPAIDLIVIYITASGTITEALTYTETAVVAGAWAPLPGDAYDPGILNLDETISLHALLSNTPEPGTEARLILTLKDGATFSRTFIF